MLHSNKNKEKKFKLDIDVEKNIKKYPRFMRKKLRKLYVEYKKGNLIFPEGFNKENFLNKE